MCSISARGQEVRSAASSGSSASDTSETPAEIRALSDLIRGLQAQVQTLNSQLGDLRMEQERARAEARELRVELDHVKTQGGIAPGGPLNSYSAPASKEIAGQPALPSTPLPQEPQTVEDRLGKLEEDQQVMEGKINDQYQTKVESGSKYRLRLSGIVLLNLFENRGTVDNLDFPEVAESQRANEPNASPGAFGGTLRQSQIKLQAFGPDVRGARTSADVHLDFAGGFPDAPNGAWMGLVRMRTATVRLDWTNTSIVAGQDRLFFAPLAPTSLATLAIPSLSYAGNLWAWTPQVRVEHRIVLSDASRFSIQGGILDSFTGDNPPDQFDRYPSWGEQSGLPAFAARVSWTRRMFGQDLTVGAGGYYGRQNWGFNRKVDGWAGTADLTLPLGQRFEFTGAFYRGRALAGFGGGVGQSVLLNGSFINPVTTFRGLDSMGGWAQLKFKIKSNFEVNGAVGVDNPFASELRLYNANSIYPESYTRNLSPLVNFIYQIRSDILFSTEYRYLNSSVLDSGSLRDHHINLSLGYIF
ncbi:MAG TPA: hypothetical protein VNX46_11825 [Candidatus Acidoferrum sp.]|nr:hypothetical protein [Candidatus Acidoferrum sp.]